MQTKFFAAAMLSTFAAFAVAAPADAHERWRYETGKRQARHIELISEGHHNGMLTWLEFRKLRGEQFRIARMKRYFLADGRLDWSERQSLRYAQDAASNHIFRERSDRERRRHWVW